MSNLASPVARRWFLQQCGIGLGAIAAQQMLTNSDGIAAIQHLLGDCGSNHEEEPVTAWKAKNAFVLLELLR